MKVYVVTSGEYSDYSIEAVFTNKEIAWKFASMDSGRRVEKYETDSVNVKGEVKSSIRIVYDFRKDELVSVEVHNYDNYEIFVDGIITSFSPCRFIFQIENTMKNYFKAMKAGTCSQWMLKIARDRFSAFLESQQKSKDEMIKQSVHDSEVYTAEFYKNLPPALMYKTASPSGIPTIYGIDGDSQ